MTSRIDSYVTVGLLDFAREALAHYEGEDVVVLLDLRQLAPELSAFPREDLANQLEVPDKIAQRLAKPSGIASGATPEQASFWFLLVPPYWDETECAAIRLPARPAPGGDA
ncbi:MAG: hypothetical protein Q4G39_08685 [Brachymonas sp.]|nr:hypothetical protein [Brachymonas sp.]